EQWRALNPQYEVVVMDQVGAREQLADFPLSPDELSHQALSDVLRSSLLAEGGGVWVDATVLPARPLDTWLDGVMTSSRFFAFHAPAPDRPVASWFLAAEHDDRLMRLWWDAVRAYWTKSRKLADVPGPDIFVPADPVAAVSPATAGSIYPYFWFHYL